MKILDGFLKNLQNKEIDEDKKDKSANNIEAVNEKNNNQFIDALQKQVVYDKKVSSVETAIRPGDGMGMNTKISG